MTLAEKLKSLRTQEGKARGLDRALTQSEVSRLIRAETGKGFTQAYLSQLESGKRRHLTAGSRHLLARFFSVHPGYLVDDPPARSAGRTTKSPLARWLAQAAEQARQVDPGVASVLRELAADRAPQRYFELVRVLRRDRATADRAFKENGIG